MILLDTDHLTILRYRESAQHDLLMERLNESLDDDVATSVVSVEEQLRGWLAEIHRCRRIEDQSSADERLAEQIEFLANWPIIRFDPRATNEFAQLRRARIRIGTQDLKIAAIALAQEALLLSANLRDFEQVPGLRVENWLAD